MIYVIVPAYNEERHVGLLLKKLVETEVGKKKIVVMDDGSSDNTYNIAKKYGVTVLRHKENLGKGYAIRNALWHVYFRARKNDIIFLMDGDGQHDPRDMKKFLDKLKVCDVVVGKRDLKNYPLTRRIANKMYSSFLNFIYGVNGIDWECGFRAFRFYAIERILPKLTSKKFEIETEMLSMLIKNKFTVGCVKIRSPFLNRKRKIIIQGIKNLLCAMRCFLCIWQ